MSSRRTTHALIALLTSLFLAVSVTSTPAEAQQQRKQTRGSVTWVTDTWVSGSGTGYSLSGTVSGARKRPLLLQYKGAQGWQRLARTKAVDNAFTFNGTWDWYGTHKVRVLAPATRRHSRRAFEAHRVNVVPSYTARGLAGDHNLLRFNGLRERVNPCQPIRYKLNLDDIGDGVLPIIDSVLFQFTQATGVRFKYVGRTHTIPQGRRTMDRGTDLIIAWASQSERPALAGAVAVSQIVKLDLGRDRKGRVWSVKQTGVTVNSDLTVPGSPNQAVDIALDSPSRATLGMTLLHELGHGFGLAHTDRNEAGRAQLMYFSTDNLPWSNGWFRSLFGAGDLAGLRKVGLAAGCVRD
ncbi:hypothetical protein [uncultured Nocardioides sp.]|uniref:Peptidase M10 metallopeptidase domain-containing protein n=1 Tax=uncultured Nocardioides sp. TaxID=198441 RepID=A0A6J4N3J0_9ACTN|nr:hypothetical protein [uncultured Nocardioides sp.]CAA9376405.1 MAG: hypothetical protein AVDCRST_MAG06-546 [uncultured Nocardioides sp.]